MSRWFRHYAGMMRDDKLVSVAIRSKQTIERVVWVWGAILESATEIDDDGRFDVDPAEIAYFLRSDEADIRAVIDELANAGRIASGAVVKWGDRQFQSDRSAARQAAYRERKRAARGDSDGQQGAGNGRVTSLSRHRDAPDTESETDTEIKNEASASLPARQPISAAKGIWNENAAAVGWPTIQNMSAGRQKGLGCRLRQYGLDGWRACIARARASPYLAGADPPHWFTFDWLIKPTNFEKVTEGNYDRRHTDNSDPTLVALARFHAGTA